MASKKKPANFKVTKSKNKTMTAVLIGLATALIVIVIGVILLHANQTSDKTFQTAEKVDNGSVNLGSLVFRIEGDKAVVRNDSATQEIRDFLKAEVKKSGCKDNNGVAVVIAHSQDEKQLLLGYGCGNSAARMFAVKQDGGWKAISPTIFNVNYFFLNKRRFLLFFLSLSSSSSGSKSSYVTISARELTCLSVSRATDTIIRIPVPPIDKRKPCKPVKLYVIYSATNGKIATIPRTIEPNKIKRLTVLIRYFSV